MNKLEKDEKITIIQELLMKNKLSFEEKEFIINELNAILVDFPTDADALYNLAYYYEIEGKYQEAIDYYSKALEYTTDEEFARLIESFIETCKLSIDIASINENPEEENEEVEDNNPYWYLRKLSPKWLLILKIIILCVVLFKFYPSLFFGFNDNKILKNTEYNKVVNQVQEAQEAPQNASQEVSDKNSEDFVVLNVGPLETYNYLSKKQIYDIRKKYVKTSLFASENYEPNERIFGSIVDNKPWWTIKPCSKLGYKGDYHERIEGPSKLSALVNSPNSLVGLSMTYSPWEYEENKEFCNTELGYFVPKLSYNEQEKLIVATYKVPSNLPEYRVNINGESFGYPIQLSGLNALDFGYDYVYAIETSGIAMMYPESSNVTTDVQTFADYLHLGGSCQYKDGCNNLSPMQNNLMFNVRSLPATMTLKLWKKQPLNKYVKADFYYKIIIEGDK